MFFHIREREAAVFSAGAYDDVYFDTCSLLEEELGICLRRLIPELIRSGRKILIPHPVLQELSYLCVGVTSNCRGQARQAKDLVCKLEKEGLAEFTGQPEYSEQADHYFVKTVSADRFHRRIALITQDRQLTEDINRLNQISCAKVNPVHTFHLEKGTPVRTPIHHHPKDGAAGNPAEICRRLGL